MNITLRSRSVAVVNAWKDFLKDPVSSLPLLASTINDLKRFIDEENCQDIEKRQLNIFGETTGDIIPVGQKIMLRTPCYWSYLLKKTGMVGTIVSHRSYGTRGKSVTHYVVKWDYYKLNHQYKRFEIENYCDII